MKLFSWIGGVALLMGTIIGVGIFALPFVIHQAGFPIGVLELLVGLVVMIFIHLMYGDIALYYRTPHQLPGYAKLSLGSLPAALASVSGFLGFSGILLVYILLGSQFLGFLITPFFGALAHQVAFFFFILLGLVVFHAEIFFTEEVSGIAVALFIIFIFSIIVFGFSHGSFAKLQDIHPANIFAPLGVIIFALFGGAVIPQISESNGARSHIKSIIIVGTVIPAIIYILFVAAVLMVSSSHISHDSIAGLAEVLGRRGVLFRDIAGFLAILTPYIGLGTSFKRMMYRDFKFPRRIAWLIASFLPGALVLFGISDFLAVVRFIGSSSIVIDVFLLFLVWYRLPKKTLIKV